MKKPIIIKNKISKFSKSIKVSGDKSISIRWALLASQAIGKSKAYNILKSEDVLSTLKCLKKLGIKIKLKNEICEIDGNGLNSYNYKKNLVLNAGNSGTLGRLILGLLINSPKKIKLIGDKSLSKRDFSRVIKPLQLFGVKIKSRQKRLPIEIIGNDFLRPIKYNENIGSAQVKSCIILAALNTPGNTILNSKHSRNHTELMLKFLKYPIKIQKKKILKKFQFPD